MDNSKRIYTGGNELLAAQVQHIREMEQFYPVASESILPPTSKAEGTAKITIAVAKGTMRFRDIAKIINNIPDNVCISDMHMDHVDGSDIAVFEVVL